MTYLVFVWLGESLPNWAEISLSVNSKNRRQKVILLCNKSIGTLQGNFKQVYIEDFYVRPKFINEWYSSSESNFRDFFWIKTSERFFIIEQYMINYQINKIFHAEIDNIIFDITDLDNKLDALGFGFFCPRDSETRGVASLIYINNVIALKELREFYEKNFSCKINDMQVIGNLFNTKPFLFHSLPTEMSLIEKRAYGTLDYSLTGGIFDAASLGQYLLGIDIRNSYSPIYNGFVNENTSPEIKDFNYFIDIEKKVFLIENNNMGINIQVFNLHIHSKNLYLVKNDILNKIIFKLKKGKKVLIGWKVPLVNKVIFKDTV